MAIPLIKRVHMTDWVCDVVFLYKGKERKRTLATQGSMTEDAARRHFREAMCSGRRSLPPEHWMARPAFTITDMTICRRANHPRYRKETNPQNITDMLIAKG